jgi:hypothetical protein
MRCNVQNIRENKVFSSYFFIYAGIPHIKHITSHTCILAALVQLLLVREGIHCGDDGQLYEASPVSHLRRKEKKSEKTLLLSRATAQSTSPRPS